jgi:hypothetical protein
MWAGFKQSIAILSGVPPISKMKFFSSCIQGLCKALHMVLEVVFVGIMSDKDKRRCFQCVWHKG